MQPTQPTAPTVTRNERVCPSVQQKTTENSVDHDYIIIGDTVLYS